MRRKFPAFCLWRASRFLKNTQRTTSPTFCSETNLLCQNKKQSNGLERMRAKANRRRRKQANLYGRRWNIFAKENTAHDLASKPSRSDYPRRDERALSCRRRREARPKQRNRLRVTCERQNRGANRRSDVRVASEKRSSANPVSLPHAKRCRGRRAPLHDDVPRRVDPAPQKKQRASVSEHVN